MYRVHPNRNNSPARYERIQAPFLFLIDHDLIINMQILFHSSLYYVCLCMQIEEAIGLVRRVSDIRSHGSQQFIESIRIAWRARCGLPCASLHSSDRVPLPRTITWLLR